MGCSCCVGDPADSLGVDLVADLPGEREEVIATVGREDLDGNWLQQVAPLVHLANVFVRELTAPARRNQIYVSAKQHH